MEGSLEWKLLQICCDKMGLTIKVSVTYSSNDHFCSIVIDGLLIAATKGNDLFDTINATVKKTIRKIKDYSQQKEEHVRPEYFADIQFDVEFESGHLFPLFKKYIVNFKEQVEAVSNNNFASKNQNFVSQNYFPSVLSPSLNDQTVFTSMIDNSNYYLTKNYTTKSDNCVKVKTEPREIKVVKRSMLYPSVIERQNCIDQSNIGFKMLLGLGWAGGPLGINQDGIAEPISVELRTRRSGLGCVDRQQIQSTFGNVTYQHFFHYLKQYADDEQQFEDLEFSDDFSIKEKKKLFGISKDLNLHHMSEQRNGILVIKIMKPSHK